MIPEFFEASLLLWSENGMPYLGCKYSRPERPEAALDSAFNTLLKGEDCRRKTRVRHGISVESYFNGIAVLILPRRAGSRYHPPSPVAPIIA